MNTSQSSNGWPQRKLGEFFRIKHGFAFKGEYFSDQGQYILLTPGNYKADGGIKLKGEKEKYYSGEFPSEYLLRRGDLTVVLTDLTQNAPILGSAAFINADNLFLHNQRLGKIADVRLEEIDLSFLYYLFNSPSVRAQIRASATGSTVRHTAPDRIYAVNVLVPPLPTQRKIASILSAYDDLIENNTRRIQILEEMARILYREWFVEFRFPGHEMVTMVESELGAVPEGWEVVPLEQMYKTGSGGTPSRKVNEFYGGNIPWIKTMELNDGYILDSEESITEEGLQKSSAKLFPSNTVIVAMYGATIGKLGILSIAACTNQACCALLPKESPFGHAYIYLSLLEHRNKLIALGQGAAQQNISQVVVKGFPLLKPPAKHARNFNSIVDPLLDSIKLLQQRNQILRRTRDLLLPRLISGEVDVSDLEIPIPETFTESERPAPAPKEPPRPARPAPVPQRRSVPARAVVAEPAPAEYNAGQPTLFDTGESVPEKRASVIIEAEDAMAAFRRAARGHGAMSRHELLRAAAQELGYGRLGPRIEEALRRHLRAAVRRRIIGTERDDVWLDTPTMESYTRDELIETIRSVMRKGTWYDREDVIRAVASHLGFQRLRETVVAPIKSAINGAIRRGVVEYEGRGIRRVG